MAALRRCFLPGPALTCSPPPCVSGSLLPAECIPGYPDQNLPTVLLYRDTKCLQTMVGLRHFGGRGTSPELVGCGSGRGRAWEGQGWDRPGGRFWPFSLTVLLLASPACVGVGHAAACWSARSQASRKLPLLPCTVCLPGCHQSEPAWRRVRRRLRPRGASARPDPAIGAAACRGAAAGREQRRHRSARTAATR